MDYPFQVGQTYENENGPYTVLAINPPKMIIEYEGGHMARVTIAVQSRIHDRISAERQLAAHEKQHSARAGRPLISFTGLQDSDFKKRIEGTSWRGREGLGGLVAQQLSTLSGEPFESLAIYPQSRFFVYPPHLPMISQQDGVKLPKFEVRLDVEYLHYSFHIEKSDGPMDGAWYWLRFLELLGTGSWQKRVSKVMVDRGLHWHLHFEAGFDAFDNPLPEERFEVHTFAEGRRFSTFAHFLTFLRELPARQWCNLYIARQMPKEEAIKLGINVSRPISQAFNDLVPLFVALL